jgi:hypothetical protein
MASVPVRELVPEKVVGRAPRLAEGVLVVRLGHLRCVIKWIRKQRQLRAPLSGPNREPRSRNVKLIRRVTNAGDSPGSPACAPCSPPIAPRAAASRSPPARTSRCTVRAATPTPPPHHGVRRRHGGGGARNTCNAFPERAGCSFGAGPRRSVPPPPGTP